MMCSWSVWFLLRCASRRTPVSKQFVYPEPDRVDFDKHGAYGKFFGSDSPLTQHLVLETKSSAGYDRILKERDTEFDYYVIKGRGEVVIEGQAHKIKAGDLIIIPPGNAFTFNGDLKMLLINT